jgi:hypothetical protein
VWLIFAAFSSIRLRRATQNREKITHEGIRFSLMLARSDLMRRSRSCDNETNTNSCGDENFGKHSCGDIEAEESQLWKSENISDSRYKSGGKKLFLLSPSVFVYSHLATSPRENYMLNSRLVFYIFFSCLAIEIETTKGKTFSFSYSPSRGKRERRAHLSRISQRQNGRKSQRFFPCEFFFRQHKNGEKENLLAMLVRGGRRRIEIE